MTQEQQEQEPSLTQDLAVHHHLPSVDGKVGIVKAPVEYLGGGGLIGRVVVRSQVLVSETVSSGDTLAGVKDQHLFQQVERYEEGGVRSQYAEPGAEIINQFFVDSPKGSALVNFLLNGTRSRLGKL
jgi:hypothetical protein